MKKMVMATILNVVNVSIVAAWRVHCRVAMQKMDHLTFLREVALCLLKAELAQPRHQLGGGPHTNLPDDVRFDGVVHYRLSCSQGRCRVCQARALVQNAQNVTLVCTVTKEQYVLIYTTHVLEL